MSQYNKLSNFQYARLPVLTYWTVLVNWYPPLLFKMHVVRQLHTIVLPYHEDIISHWAVHHINTFIFALFEDCRATKCSIIESTELQLIIYV